MKKPEAEAEMAFGKRRKLLRVNEAAELLGVSVNTLYGWTCQRKIPYLKIGRLLKFDECEVMQWIEKRRVGAVEF